MDGGAWWAAVHGVAKNWTRLRDFTFTFNFSLSCTGEGNGNPLQCSCLENPRDGGAWWAAVYGVAQSRTRLKRLSSSSSSSVCMSIPMCLCITNLLFKNTESWTLLKFFSVRGNVKRIRQAIDETKYYLITYLIKESQSWYAKNF